MPAWGKNGERWFDVNVSKQTLVRVRGNARRLRYVDIDW
jgi:hypothetical protein